MHPAIRVQINLARIRQNITDIRARTGVPIIAVVKADAYGTGAARIVPAIDDLVDSFYVLEPREVIDAGLDRLTARQFIATVCGEIDAATLLRHRIRPAVWTAAQATRWRGCDPVLAVDTGQQRFAAPAEALDEVAAAGECREAFTHASIPSQARQFADLTDRFGFARRHAAGSSLLETPAARYDAVRPGFAMYRASARVWTRLLDARDGRGPTGYTGFSVPRHGVIFGGYSDGMSAGVVGINGFRRRVLEVGMQTAFVELGPADKMGDEVVLLGNGVGEPTEFDVAASWRCGTHEALLRLARAGVREYQS